MGTNEMSNQLISVCCNGGRCEYSSENKLNISTCGGRLPGEIFFRNYNICIFYFIVVSHVVLTYILPDGIKPKFGLMDAYFIKVFEKIVKRIII
jgi:hypothetical protein